MGSVRWELYQGFQDNGKGGLMDLLGCLLYIPCRRLFLNHAARALRRYVY